MEGRLEIGYSVGPLQGIRVISALLLCEAMLCQSTQAIHCEFLSMCSRSQAPVNPRNKCEVYDEALDEASDGAFVERSVLAGELIRF